MYKLLVFNREALKEITGGDLTLEQQLVTLFAETMLRNLRRMQDIIESDNNKDDWPAVVHELKGAAATIHAERIAAICEEVEKTGPEKYLQSYGRVREAYAQFMRELANPPR